ncbi:MAG TPA: folylpolyglutamate synthase/dihydrofolate synthase family protein [Gemmatimonadales bacterium]|nr:folylpolyglutamate synthase/dihydrofolate synthase family protein [Gemmatimonadales bacterium]
MTLSYPDALDYIFPRITTIKFGLDTTRALLSELGDPQQLFAIVHIGGTNGKGSVATLVADALAGAGFRTGLYTSPHLVSFRERIRVDGQMISQAAVAMWVERLRPLIEATGATFFEATTAVAFADFAARGVEIAVVEVGLGGRLDSTNVVSPLVSAVTKVARDHMKYLGDTLEDIAREKAAIAKPGAPFVIGETEPALVQVLADAAQQSLQAMDPGARADLRVVPPDDRWEGSLGLAGPHQRRNAAVARAVLEALPREWQPPESATMRAFAGAQVPGRLDQRGKWLFDVAHNPDGMDALVRSLAALDPPRPLHALVSILGDKEWPEMLVRLDAIVDRGILTVAPTAEGRGWDLAWLQQWLARPDRPPAHADWHLEPEFRRAVAQVGEGAGTVVVTGSFHTVGDVMAELGMMDGD